MRQVRRAARALTVLTVQVQQAVQRARTAQRVYGFSRGLPRERPWVSLRGVLWVSL